jgi:hypothetical protein
MLEVFEVAVGVLLALIAHDLLKRFARWLDWRWSKNKGYSRWSYGIGELPLRVNIVRAISGDEK